MQVQTALMSSDEKLVLEKCIRDKKRILLIIRIASLSGPLALLVANYFIHLVNFIYYFPVILISEISVMLIISRIISKSIVLASSDSEKGIKETISGTVNNISSRNSTFTLGERIIELPLKFAGSLKSGDKVTVHVAKESGCLLSDIEKN